MILNRIFHLYKLKIFFLFEHGMPCFKSQLSICTKSFSFYSAASEKRLYPRLFKKKKIDKNIDFLGRGGRAEGQLL